MHTYFLVTQATQAQSISVQTLSAMADSVCPPPLPDAFSSGFSPPQEAAKTSNFQKSGKSSLMKCIDHLMVAATMT